MVCLALYIPTILAIFKPIDKEAASAKNKKKVAEAEMGSDSDKIDFNVDFNAPDQKDEPDAELKIDGLQVPTRPEKAKNKPKRKRK